MITIAIDMMGGDNAPTAILDGCLSAAAAHPDWAFRLVAQAAVIAATPALPKNASWVPCGSQMAMDEDVRSLLHKRDSSIWIATEMVKRGAADAVVSAGSTAAQMAAATLLLSRVPGVERPAIGTLMPTPEGFKLLLDVGANVDCTARMLLQFAQMGAVYARQLLGIAEPRIALLVNGTEAHKGNAVTREAYTLLQESGLCFLGNREARDLLVGGYDVLVCDGMSGNVAIKAMEGAVNFLMKEIRATVNSSPRNKMGGMLLKSGLRRVKKKLDYEEIGGAPLLGVAGVSIVCHGSSKAGAIAHAIEVAAACVESEFVAKLCAATKENGGEFA